MLHLYLLNKHINEGLGFWVRKTQRAIEPAQMSLTLSLRLALLTPPKHTSCHGQVSAF